MTNVENTRIDALKALITPNAVKEQLPTTAAIAKHVVESRHRIESIIQGQSKQRLVVVGPCSIHDPNAALEYAERLATIAPQYQNTLQLVMRVYFEKPRTQVGWKGFINDPHLDGSFDINQGLRTARKLLLDINQLGVATASEFLDAITPQYFSDLVSWGAIGARTVESQLHREIASGLSMPVGFKNSTNGNTQIAIDAMHAANKPHHFLGINQQGAAAIVSTQGNRNTHLILRGSTTAPNYQADTVAQTIAALQEASLNRHIMIDCSHGNSGRDHLKQLSVASDVAKQIAAGNQHIMGVMLESHLVAGNQQLKADKQTTYGQSITDACMSWETTTQIIEVLANAVVTSQTKS